MKKEEYFQYVSDFVVSSEVDNEESLRKRRRSISPQLNQRDEIKVKNVSTNTPDGIFHWFGHNDNDDIKKFEKKEDSNLKVKPKKSLLTKLLNILSFYFTNTWRLLLVLWFVCILCAGVLLCQLENETLSKYSTYPPISFRHPFLQALQVFLSKLFICLLPSYFWSFVRRTVCCGENRRRDISTLKGKGEMKKPFDMFYVIIPTLFNAIGVILLIVALTFTYASIVMVLQCGVVLTTFILSILLLKRKFYKLPHKWIGIFFVIGGVMVIGVSILLHPTGEGKAKVRNPWVGALLSLISVIFISLMMVSEEWILSSFDTNALEVTGYEGFWGTIIMIILLFVLYYIPGNDFGSLDNAEAGIVQFFGTPILFIFAFLSVIPTIGCIGYSGNLITKHLSAATRTVVAQLPPMIVWVVQIARGRQDFTFLQLLGYFVVAIGALLYNGVGLATIFPFYYDWCVDIMKAKKVAPSEGEEEKKEEKRQREEVELQEYQTEKMKNDFFNLQDGRKKKTRAEEEEDPIFVKKN